MVVPGYQNAKLVPPCKLGGGEWVPRPSLDELPFPVHRVVKKKKASRAVRFFFYVVFSID